MKILTYVSLLLNLIFLSYIIFSRRLEERLSSEKDKAFYSLGAELGKTLIRFNMTEEEVSKAALGFKHQALKNPLLVSPNESVPQIQTIEAERIAAAAQGELSQGESYLSEIARKEGVEKLNSGLLIKTSVVGRGRSPKITDLVKIDYEGRLRDGTIIDSSIKRGQPGQFRLSGVIPCWSEALQRMKPGGKATIFCPSNLAYGAKGAPPIVPGGAALIFDIELLSIDSIPGKN